MDFTDKEKFQTQMDFLKDHNFQQYLYKYRWIFMFIPFIGLFDFIFGYSYWSIILIAVKGAILISILVGEYFWMYRFYKPIALGEKQSFSKFQLFLANFVGNTLFMFVVLTNFHQFFVEKDRAVIGSIIGSVFFGLSMSGIFTACLNESLKDYLNNRHSKINQFLNPEKENADEK